MDNRVIREEYALIAHDLIKQEDCLADIRASEATIVYLGSDYEKTSKGKKVCAECEKISDKYKWGIPADFTITVFEKNVRGFTDDQMKILILHELLHVGISWDNNGVEKYEVKPHDYEDFKIITDRYGTEWAEVKARDIEIKYNPVIVEEVENGKRAEFEEAKQERSTRARSEGRQSIGRSQKKEKRHQTGS